MRGITPGQKHSLTERYGELSFSSLPFAIFIPPLGCAMAIVDIVMKRKIGEGEIALSVTSIVLSILMTGAWIAIIIALTH